MIGRPLKSPCHYLDNICSRTSGGRKLNLGDRVTQIYLDKGHLNVSACFNFENGHFCLFFFWNYFLCYILIEYMRTCKMSNM